MHPTDPVRLDLKIPPESHMYLRAASSAERQQWLVALGTSKACRVDTNYEEQQQQSRHLFLIKETVDVVLCQSSLAFECTLELDFCLFQAMCRAFNKGWLLGIYHQLLLPRL